MKNYIVYPIKTFYKNLSIKRKLLLLFFVQIITVFVLMGYMFYQKAAEIIEDKSITYTQDILKMIELRLNDFSENMITLSQDLLYDQVTYDVLIKENEDNVLAHYNNTVNARNILRKKTLARDEIQSICLVSKEGKIYSFDQDSRKANIQEILPYDSMLPFARGAKGKAVWYLDKSDEGVKNIFLIRIIYSRDNFKEIGLMAILVNKDFLESTYQDLSTEYMQNISIVSDENLIIVSRDKSEGYIETKGMEENKNYYINQEKDILVSYLKLNDPKWKIVTHISLDELYRDMNTFKKWAFLSFFGAFITLSIFSILTASDIVAPINKLVKGMKRVQQGEHKEIYIDRNDELGFLSHRFNEMSKELDYFMKWVYREQITRKEAELKALQAQINPHFLFNTLESINWMAQLNGVPEISNMVSSLSSLMEAGIGRDNRLITFKEEMKYIDDYIYILKMRYGERLEFCADVDEEIMQVRIPRLLIQPLIENAIYHGIDKSRKKGKVEIYGTQVKSKIILEIRDNGMGIPKEELERLNMQFQNPSREYFKTIHQRKEKGIGLENVNQRIKLFYGEQYGLKIDSEYGQYTKIVVVIPVEKRGIENVQSTHCG